MSLTIIITEKLSFFIFHYIKKKLILISSAYLNNIYINQ